MARGKIGVGVDFFEGKMLKFLRLWQNKSTPTPFFWFLSGPRVGAAALAVGAVLLALGARPSAASEFDCLPLIERTIDELGLDRADISHTQNFTRSTGRLARWPHMEAWIWFKSCRGNVVIELQYRADCRVKQVYSLGDCTLPTRP